MHSNGHRYYPFHIDLYGISYIDVDTLEVYNYIPQGSRTRETFIITDIHYDKNTDLIAYGGCMWACSSDVMAGDFSQPLCFDPRLISINETIDPEYEKDLFLGFKKWENGILYVTVNKKDEFSISAESIMEKIKNIDQNAD